MRNIAKHAIAGAARGLQVGLVAQDLHLDALHGRRAEHDGRSRAAIRETKTLTRTALRRTPGRKDRAVTLVRPLAVDLLRLQHVTAELAYDLTGRSAEQPCHLCIGVTNAPLV